MANYTSSSYLDEDFTGVIKIYSDEIWPTTNWTAEVFFDSVYTEYDLYSVFKSGVGYLTDGGYTLNIDIPFPPKVLLLTVGVFAKEYNFIEGGVQGNKELVWAPSFLITHYNTTSSKAIEGFILFNHLPNEVLQGGVFKATLAIGDDVVGFLLGDRFLKVTGTGGEYNFGGIVFSRCVWTSKPPAGDLRFLLPLEDGVFSTTVDWNGATFTGPTSPRFNVLSDHRFYLERFRTNFYL